MRAAIYARVSTERQERQQTIGSQVSALRNWAAAGGHALAEAHVFQDEGFSGSRLDRPALDALRDAVRDAAIDVVAVFSPPCLAAGVRRAEGGRPVFSGRFSRRTRPMPPARQADAAPAWVIRSVVVRTRDGPE